MPPVHVYTNWNSRATDSEPKIEPYRKYFLICEGKNTETWYFQKLIDLRQELRIHPLIDIRLMEKTEEDADISYPKNLIEFAKNKKKCRRMHLILSGIEWSLCLTQIFSKRK